MLLLGLIREVVFFQWTELNAEIWLQTSDRQVLNPKQVIYTTLYTLKEIAGKVVEKTYNCEKIRSLWNSICGPDAAIEIRNS